MKTIYGILKVEVPANLFSFASAYFLPIFFPNKKIMLITIIFIADTLFFWLFDLLLEYKQRGLL